MARPGKIDAAKEKYWRERLLDWQLSGLGVTEFCRRTDIKLSSFVDWRRKLQKRDQEARKLSLREGRAAVGDQGRPSVVNFAPVILNDSQPGSSSGDPVLGVLLRSGILINVRETCPPSFLARVVQSLEGGNV